MTEGAPRQENSQEKLNQFGLPENWSHDRSLQALDFIKRKLEGHVLEKDIPPKLLEHVFDITSQEYKKYRGEKSSPIYTRRVGADFPSELEHLKMNPEDKLDHFKKRWPKGLEIMGTGEYMKWEKALDYELWAMGRHDQTFATLQRRGGLDAIELAKILFGINSNEKTTKEKVLKYFEDNDMLVK